MSTRNDPAILARPRGVPARPSHIWRWLEYTLLLIGVLCLGYYVYVSIEARLYQEIENRELDSILASAPPPPTPPGIIPRSPSSAPRMPPPVPRPRPSPGSALGRIEIPRLGVSAIIRVGSDARTLRLAVGHIPGTAFPGEAGNIGLAGHRDTFFRRLQNIRASDDIRIVTTSGTFAFRVNMTEVVSPKDTSVLRPTRTSTLTLVTCYPFTYIGSAPQRFIVRAVASPSRPANRRG
jgi:sortase A